MTTTTVLIIALVASIGLSVTLALGNTKLKAKNTKLKVENENLQYELGKTLLNKDQLETEIKEHSTYQDRIEAIKEKFKQTSEIKPLKKATKKDVEAFYESQKPISKKRKLKVIEK